MTKLIGSAEFAGLVDAASGDRGIPPGDIEKDIWVVEVLRSIFRPIDGARVVFKGGTSLSKAYGLIERFSEDVDLLVVADAGMGAGQRERVLKTLPGRAAEELGIETKKEGERRGSPTHPRVRSAALRTESGGFGHNQTLRSDERRLPDESPARFGQPATNTGRS